MEPKLNEQEFARQDISEKMIWITPVIKEFDLKESTNSFQGADIETFFDYFSK